jgi:hypothetical protein
MSNTSSGNMSGKERSSVTLGADDDDVRSIRRIVLHEVEKVEHILRHKDGEVEI